MDQQSLVEQARQGDQDAFAALVRGSIDRLDTAARLILRDPELARDAVQEALIRAWRDLRSLRDPERFDAWLYRLTVNACLDLDRGRRRRPVEVEITPLFTPVSPDPYRDFADRELVDAMLRRLDARERSIVVLHYYLGLPLTEVAHTLRIPVGTVKSRLHRALGELRSNMPPDAASPSRQRSREDARMTADRRLDLPLILSELGAAPHADYADSVLEGVALTRQRPAWTFPGRWLPLDLQLYRVPTGPQPLRQLALLLLLVAAIAGAAILSAGSRPHLPKPFGPADNGLLIYASSGDVYTADVATGISTPISVGPEHYDFAPFFSRDGSQVAFLRRVNPDSDLAIDIVVAAADGSGARVVTPAPLAEIPSIAKWTPDGRSIAIVTSARADSVVELLDARGSSAPRVIEPGMHLESLAFQPPDGRRILFTGQSGFTIGLYTMNLDGSDRVAIVPPFLPGAQLNKVNFFIPDCSASNCPNWAIYDRLDGTWSPDGTKVVVRKWALVDDLERVQLVLMNADGSDPHVVGYVAGDLMATDPAFSPDGSKIAFLRFRDAAFGFAVVNLADDVVTPVGPEITGGLADIEWSPDGTQLLVTEHSGDRNTLIVSPNGGSWRTMRWAAEAPSWWLDREIPNVADPGNWQRKASP